MPCYNCQTSQFVEILIVFRKERDNNTFITIYLNLSNFNIIEVCANQNVQILIIIFFSFEEFAFSRKSDYLPPRPQPPKRCESRDAHGIGQGNPPFGTRLHPQR